MGFAIAHTHIHRRTRRWGGRWGRKSCFCTLFLFQFSWDGSNGDAAKVNVLQKEQWELGEAGGWDDRRVGVFHHIGPLVAFSKADEPRVASAWASSQLVSGLIGREYKPGGAHTHTHTQIHIRSFKVPRRPVASIETLQSCDVTVWATNPLLCLCCLYLSQEQRANTITTNSEDFLNFLFGVVTQTLAETRQDKCHATSGRQAPATEAQSAQLCYLPCADSLLVLLFRPEAKPSFRFHFNSGVSFGIGTVALLSTASHLKVASNISTQQTHTALQTINVFFQIPSKSFQLKEIDRNHVHLSVGLFQSDIDISAISAKNIRLYIYDVGLYRIYIKSLLWTL